METNYVLLHQCAGNKMPTDTIFYLFIFFAVVCYVHWFIPGVGHLFYA